MCAKRVLEFGCGIGTDTMNFPRAGAEAMAVDLSDKSLEVARQRAGVYELSNIRFCHGNAEEPSSFLPLEPYDLICSFGAIHHTPHPECVIEQLRAYCRPETTSKLLVYHRHCWKALQILLCQGHGALWRFSELLVFRRLEKHLGWQLGVNAHFPGEREPGAALPC